MATTPRMSKAKATKMARAKLRFGHFREDDYTLYTYCPEDACRRKVTADVGNSAIQRDQPPGDPIVTPARRERRAQRLLEEALIAHLMDPDHDEEN